MQKPYTFFFIILLIMNTIACNDETNKQAIDNNYKQGSFGYDLAFLQQHDSVVVLKDGNAQVIVSPKYQSKVFTSTADGLEGKSFGWINYKAFTAPVDSHMNAYGGENRLWLGPEGGPFSLFFPKGSEMTFANWKTPPPIDTEAWSVTGKDEKSVSMKKDMQLTNYAGTPFHLSIDRTVTVLNKNEIKALTKTDFNPSVKVVGYSTDNKLTNTGSEAWNEKKGAPCIWILDMFNPSPATVIAIPYEHTSDTAAKIATTDYFGEIPADRIKYQNGVLLFKADGQSRGKLGIGPLRAKPIAGSYDSQNGVLTLTFFDVAKDGKYLNQEWTTKKPPFSGDAVNAYNDGPLEDGKQMGPFYELESVSPAAFLKPGASLSHKHTVLHFTGNKQELNSIAKKLLGISLEEIASAFK